MSVLVKLIFTNGSLQRIVKRNVSINYTVRQNNATHCSIKLKKLCFDFQIRFCKDMNINKRGNYFKAQSIFFLHGADFAPFIPCKENISLH